MLFLSVTEVDDTGALDSVAATARRRIFSSRKYGPDLHVLSSIFPAHGGTQLGASCDTQVR